VVTVWQRAETNKTTSFKQACNLKRAWGVRRAACVEIPWLLLRQRNYEWGAIYGGAACALCESGAKIAPGRPIFALSLTPSTRTEGRQAKHTKHIIIWTPDVRHLIKISSRISVDNLYLMSMKAQFSTFYLQEQFSWQGQHDLNWHYALIVS
jgi:hypothetical protein